MMPDDDNPNIEPYCFFSTKAQFNEFIRVHRDDAWREGRDAAATAIEQKGRAYNAGDLALIVRDLESPYEATQ